MTEIKPVLEPEAVAFCEATDTPPFLYQLPPAEGPPASSTALTSVARLPTE